MIIKTWRLYFLYSIELEAVCRFRNNMDIGSRCNSLFIIIGIDCWGGTGLASFAIFNQSHQLQLIGAVFMIVAFLFLRHRENIDKLRAGQERRIGEKNKS